MTTPTPSPTPSIQVVDQHTIAKLSPRAIGQMTYRIGVDDAGGVYLAVAANQGSGCFSPEWIALNRIRAVVAPYAASGAPLATPVLRDAYVKRSINNAGFLAAVLRHTGLLEIADPPHLHRVAPDWDTWEATQRQRYQPQETPETPEASEAVEETPPQPPQARRRR